MGGELYPIIMAAVFGGVALLMLLLWGLFKFFHWLEKRETGATHGFLELPTELRKPVRAQGGGAEEVGAESPHQAG